MKHIYLLFVAVFAIQTVQSQIVNIPDANFKNALLNNNQVIDINGDGEIQVSEAEAISNLSVYNQNISLLDGIEYFVNLTDLNIANNQISTVNLSNLTNIEDLKCYANNLTELNIQDLTNLDYLWCSTNNLTSIDTSQNINLNYLNIQSNQITNLNLEQNPNLTSLYCSSNPLTSVNLSHTPNLILFHCFNIPMLDYDLTHVPNLEYFSCASSQLTTLDLSMVPNLKWLNCEFNQLTELNIGHLNNLQSIIFRDNLLTTFDSNGVDQLRMISGQNNQLETVFLKDGYSGGYYDFFEYLTEYRFDNNPIQYICVDDFGYESQYLSGYNTGTYCSFVPGGDYYTFEGNTKIDLDNNGCDASDSIYPSLKFNITDGTNEASFISNVSGDYSFAVQAGIHTITPELEFPEYFTISPTSISADFPIDASPFIQDFCVVPNGTHNDLEITILPLEDARPGFDTNYKLVYENKGTTTLSGTVDLTFNDDVMDFVSANPTADSQVTNLLSWNYSNLAPFESHEILISMSLNTPMDTSPLNGDDVLNFAATVNPAISDETPEDNVFTLNQTVVNSYDPNDKTCLEGDTITPDLIGKDVHYLIRFENTGTADAINVVVKDVINTAKFDVSTLFLTDSSHNLVTRITNTNVVEFIFENINLPFDDANNDGYIAFKIKTLPTLVEGDTFENDAEIYFDYNFPIDTNIAQTSIQNPLSTDDFELSGLEIYPNPVNNKLFIEGLETIKSVTIYDLSGRLINQVSYIGNHNKIDVSTEKLTRGAYFVKVKTDIGELIRKVIKE